jgi:hypothetical protein
MIYSVIWYRQSGGVYRQDLRRHDLEAHSQVCLVKERGRETPKLFASGAISGKDQGGACRPTGSRGLLRATEHEPGRKGVCRVCVRVCAVLKALFTCSEYGYLRRIPSTHKFDGYIRLIRFPYRYKVNNIQI